MDKQITAACLERGLFYHPESDSLFQITDPVELARFRESGSIEVEEVTGDQDWERRFLSQRCTCPSGCVGDL